MLHKTHLSYTPKCMHKLLCMSLVKCFHLSEYEVMKNGIIQTGRFGLDGKV